jgi:hypothetical protein
MAKIRIRPEPPAANGFETGNVCGWSTSLGLLGAPACPTPQQTLVEPTYSSEGLLHACGRPVAQLDLSGGVENWKHLTTDHLGNDASEDFKGPH